MNDMKIQYASDLHLELQDNMKYINSTPLPVNGEILVLAGDIHHLDDPAISRLEFWDWCADNFQYTVVVPGNHEYYDTSDILSRGESWHWMLRKNVGYYQNTAFRIGNVAFFLTTLWSVITNPNRQAVWNSLDDFNRIRCGDHAFTPSDYNGLYFKCLDFLDRGLKLKEEHKVVVTHHVPARCCIAPQNLDTPIYDAICADLDKFIEFRDADVWIYGHSHTNIDKTVGKTRIVCNQLGYVNCPGEGIGFDPGKTIEI